MDALKRALRPTLLFRPEGENDYGIDGDIEWFHERNATGLRFFVQVKSTDEEDLRDGLAAPIKMARVRQYRALPMPLLMALYRAATDMIYTRWFHQYDPYYGRGGKTQITFRWEETDVWDDNRAEQLVADAQAFYALRSPSVPLPLRFFVETDGAWGLSPTEIVFALRSAAERRPDVLAVTGRTPVRGLSSIEVTEDRVTANLATVTTATMHIEGEYIPGEHGDQLAVDAWVVGATALANIGQASLASRLAASFLAGSSILSEAEVVGGLSLAMVAARQVREGLRLARELDDPADPHRRAASLMMTLPAGAHGSSLDEDEVALYRTTLEERIARREATGAVVEAGREHYNLANLLRTRREPNESCRHYELALECDPAYAGRAHYWFEYGGVLWGAGRFIDAAQAYGRAVELGSQPLALALQADCLMYAGQYAEARELLRRFNGEHRGEGEAYRLKGRVLDTIIDRLGIISQDRNPTGASEAAEDPTDAHHFATVLDSQFSQDALWGPAWFNLGVLDREVGEREAELTDYIAAGLFPMPGGGPDLEAWKNSMLLSIGLGADDVLEDVLNTARGWAGPNFPTYLVDFARSQGPDFGRESFLAKVDEVWATPEEEPAFTVRFLDEDGTIDTVELGAHAEGDTESSETELPEEDPGEFEDHGYREPVADIVPHKATRSPWVHSETLRKIVEEAGADARLLDDLADVRGSLIDER